MKTSKIFKDQAQNDLLLKTGYVIIPFLGEEEIATLRSACDQFIPAGVDHFYATTHSSDLVMRNRANAEIKKEIEKACLMHFDRAQPLGGAFIAKPPHGKGVLSLHQDWNIVDEHSFRSYNIWIPLVDTNASNGAFHVLPSSHNKEFSIRGPGIQDGWNNLEEEVATHMTRLDMTAGYALVYDHALWHSSPPNQSKQPRPAVVCGMIEKGSPMKAYFQDEDQVSEYELTSTFFFDELDITRPTNLKKLRTFKHSNPELTIEKLQSLYLEKRIRPWWKKLLQQS